jgi:hypothetical protein
MSILEFSESAIELNMRPGEIIERDLFITASDKYAQGRIISSDTRARLYEGEFSGRSSQITYCFDASNLESESAIKGEFVVISNCGEYTIPYVVNVQSQQLECSIGRIKNLFHFTNLAQTDWAEAVEVFYSPEFPSILPKHDHNARLAYIGLSKDYGNEQNVEEFLIEVNKKNPVEYSFSVEGWILEDVQESVTKNIVINKSSWGYTNISIEIVGDFIKIDKDSLTNEDFTYNACDFNIYIDATRLHNGVNSGSIVFNTASARYFIPVDIIMDDEPQKRTDNRVVKKTTCDLINSYVEYRYGQANESQLSDSFENNVNRLLEIDEDSILYNLYRTQMLIKKERFNEAKWYLDMLEQKLSKGTGDVFLSCYYLYLTTLFNNEYEYVSDVCNEIERAYENNPEKWQLGWMVLNIDENLARNVEQKWQYMKKMYDNGCTSPLLYAEAMVLLCDNPTYILELDLFEENVIWHGARHHMLKTEIIEQIQYLAARKAEYSTLLYRILCQIYETYKSPQTIASICHILVMGDKRGGEYLKWYKMGVDSQVRVTGLYEYYMMSLETDKYGEISVSVEIPKMVLMYFAYQSNLDYKLNAFLYSYIVRNKDKYPDLEQSYRIAIERFVIDQIRAGHINVSLAYLYDNVLKPQMITDETAYAYTPLLFMHRIYVDNPNVKNVVVIHEKVVGESSYPITDNMCMIPVYGSEYKLFLQDDKGNRFTKSVFCENKQLMEPRHQIDYVSGYLQGRLSFDIYLCEVDKKYISIKPENVKRFKSIVDSPQVSSAFKKDIRTKLLKYYYDNDMIGELDAFLEDIEPENMDQGERAEFIRYLVSRGMFDKAYYWIKAYGVSEVDHKAVARLISKRIVSGDFAYDEFLVNVSYYIYKNTKYDENILRYLLINYNGSVGELRKLWRSALDLELDSKVIMERILRQVRYTGNQIHDRDEILIAYASCEGFDIELVNEILLDTAYDYFVNEAVVEPDIFEMIYDRYKSGEITDRVAKMALLKYWSEIIDNGDNSVVIYEETIKNFIHEFLNHEIYFPFYVKFADIVSELHYVRNSQFVEYRTEPASRVYIHYAIEEGDFSKGQEPEYEIREMKEMYDGIYVAMFQVLSDEVLQYYITESQVDSQGEYREYATQSDMLSPKLGDNINVGSAEDRYGILNDILVSISLKDDLTAQQLTQEYLCRDYCTRDLFRVL